MPSRFEIRCWLLIALALAWGMCLSVVWEWWQEVPGASPEAVLQHLRPVRQHGTWVALGLMLFGLAFATRCAGWLLWQDDGSPGRE